MTLRTAFRDKLAETEQKGIQKGIQQGLKQEAFLFVNRLLKRKFGELSPNLVARLENLAVETLESLGEALLDFNSLSDLINWLETHSTT
jgi:predicted transposase YdaD